MSIKALLHEIQKSFEKASTEWNSLLEELSVIRDEISRETFEEVFGKLALRCPADYAASEVAVVEVCLDPEVDDSLELTAASSVDSSADEEPLSAEDVGVVHVETTTPGPEGLTSVVSSPAFAEVESAKEATEITEFTEDERDTVGDDEPDSEETLAELREQFQAELREDDPIDELATHQDHVVEAVAEADDSEPEETSADELTDDAEAASTVGRARERKRNLETKLDTLINLVKESLDEKHNQPSAANTNVMPHQIASEVVSHIKDSLPTTPATSEETKAKDPAKKDPEPKIALDDIESMIDRLSGNGF